MTEQEKQDLKDYFQNLSQKPVVVQLRTKSLIERASNEIDIQSKLRELVTGKSRNYKVEMSTQWGEENHYLVVKSTEFQDGPGYAVVSVHLETSKVEDSSDYYYSKEEAMCAKMISLMGGAATIIGAVRMMVKGSN